VVGWVRLSWVATTMVAVGTKQYQRVHKTHKTSTRALVLWVSCTRWHGRGGEVEAGSQNNGGGGGGRHVAVPACAQNP
jgi:hypothetical protein